MPAKWIDPGQTVVADLLPYKAVSANVSTIDPVEFSSQDDRPSKIDFKTRNNKLF